MIFLLGGLDIISALSLGFVIWNISIPWLLAFLLILFLIVKIIIFFSIGFATLIDVLAAIFLILAFFIALPKIVLGLSGFLLFKGVRSIINV